MLYQQSTTVCNPVLLIQHTGFTTVHTTVHTTAMYVYMYVCMYVCTYLCMHVGVYVCMYACMHARTHACTHARTYVCMYVRCTCVLPLHISVASVSCSCTGHSRGKCNNTILVLCTCKKYIQDSEEQGRWAEVHTGE